MSSVLAAGGSGYHEGPGVDNLEVPEGGPTRPSRRNVGEISLTPLSSGVAIHFALRHDHTAGAYVELQFSRAMSPPSRNGLVT